jgi:bla regulator protein blaR1
MISTMNWLSPDLMHSLGWTLLHFIWQGMALAAVAAVVMAVCRRASVRYAVGVGVLVLMLAAPIAAFLVLQRSGETAQASPVAALWRVAVSRAAPIRSAKNLPVAPPFDILPWLVETWLVGVTLFSLRAAGGLFLIERKRRKQRAVVSERVLEICQTLQSRLGLKRAIRYCECQWLQSPAVIGWFRPIIFLPVTAITGLSEDQLRSVIAHELAHIKRFDPFVNVFQIAVETLLFYHPAVWWLNQRIRAEREHCCDDVAVSLCGNAVEYARALTLMEEWRIAPGLAMAANRGPLPERIFRVLGLTSMCTGIRSIGLTGSLLCLTAALAAGSVLLSLARPRFTASAKQPAFLFSQSQAAPKTAPAPAAKPSPARPQTDAQPAATASSYIEGLKAAGMGDVTVDQLIALKIQGVTPEYVRSVHEQGLHPDADGLVAMKVQGVTPEYIRELRGLGLELDEDQIIALKVQGVMPEYVRSLKDLGFQPDADDLVALKVQGVTPEYIRDLRSAGLTLDSENVIALKVQGVTPAYIHGLHEQGLHPSVDDVIALRVQGVTADYIKTLQSAGFKLTIDDIVAAKVQGITPEFIEQARKHGFQNLTIDKLIELKHAGVFDTQADI